MAQNNRHGRPDEEMFMNQTTAQSSSSSNPSASAAPGPLRITKTPTGSSPSVSSAPYPTAFDPPVSPPPNKPLPYPATSQPQPYNPRPATHSPPTPAGLPPSSGRLPSPQQQSQQSPPPQIVHNHHEQFSAADPYRPTVAGYGHTPHRQSDGSHTPTQTQQYAYPSPGQESGPEVPDKDDYSTAHAPQPAAPAQYHYPTPSSSFPQEGLRIPNPSGVNRLTSVSSVSTTKAARGSPPPPETPVVDQPYPGGIQARYAASGIAGPSTLTQLEAQSLAAQQQREHQQEQQRQYQYPSPQAQAGAAPASSQASSLPNQPQSPPASVSGASQASGLNQRMAGLDVAEGEEQSADPPPAYSSVSGAGQRYPQEKVQPGHPRMNLSISTDAASSAAGSAQGHPAFANDHNMPQPQPQAPAQAQAQQAQTLHQPQASTVSAASTTSTVQPGSVSSPSPAPSHASPPPLPEGWLAHMDPSSGQYYYIHLPTQSTQWEFPKGPTPLNLNGQPPLSPTGTVMSLPFASPTASSFAGKPLASPGIPTGHESMASNMSAISSPTAAGFHVPPPSAGVETYKVQPTNGVYFGPYLRYTNMDVDNGYWYGSVLIVTDAHPPTIHLHQSTDLSPNPRQLKANQIYTHQRWVFYRYDIDVRMEDDREAKWTYAVTSHLGCTRYEFLVASRYETSWRFIAHSGNDFSINVNANERQKIGGVGYMWKDILAKHVEVGGFHAQLGMGNQICADRMWKEIPALRQWTATSGKETRKNAPWSAQLEAEVSHAYFHYYTSNLDQPHLREAFAQIPHIMTINDQDIFDGFGSYPEHMQFSNMFKNIGRLGIIMYLLFQHHTTLDILGQVQKQNNCFDLFTITGTGWHFLKYLGPAVVVVGPDCRSERNPYQVMAGATYQGLFPKVAVLPPHVQHCIWTIPVPIVYPRFESAESFAQTMASGKKAVTGTFNAFGKLAGGVAGIVGAKGAVNEGFNSVKKAVGKTGLMSNVLSPFGEIDILDELRDQWTHESKDLERTYLIRTLQSIASTKSMRMSFFSGSTNTAAAGLLSDPAAPSPGQSHKAMFQIVSSSIVNTPPSQYVLKMLQPSGSSGGSNPGRSYYVPQNGQRSRGDGAPTDTKEDMLDIFGTDVNGQQRETKRLMARRNYCAVVSFDPDAVSEAFGQNSVAGSVKDGAGGAAHAVSLAVDWFVQTDAQGGYAPASATVKYGPLTIPSVAPGR